MQRSMKSIILALVYLSSLAPSICQDPFIELFERRWRPKKIGESLYFHSKNFHDRASNKKYQSLEINLGRLVDTNSDLLFDEINKLEHFKFLEVSNSSLFKRKGERLEPPNFAKLKHIKYISFRGHIEYDLEKIVGRIIKDAESGIFDFAKSV